MGGSNPVLQHHTPRVHLKHFIGDSPPGHVWTYNKLDGTTRSSIPEETGKERHFYTLDLEDGSKSYALENHFSDYESKANAPYQAMLRGSLPRGQARDDFARFLALMSVRTLSARRQTADLLGQMMQIKLHAYGTNPKAFDALIRRVEAAENRNVSPVERNKIRESLQEPSLYEYHIPKDRLLDVIGAADPITEIIADMHWRLIQARNGYLITSDNPVYVWTPPRLPLAGHGRFLHPAAEVTFPLSPKCSLLITRNTTLPMRLECGQEQVKSMNDKRARNAERWLFAHVRDQRIVRLANSHKNSRPRAQFHNAGFKFGPIKAMRK